jgi:hypothetical protein
MTDTISNASSIACFCPGTIGQDHRFEDGSCIYCGTEDPTRQHAVNRLAELRNSRGLGVCPATLPQFRLMEPAPSITVLPFGDKGSLQRAQACMELNRRYSPHSLIKEANKLAADWMGLPGIRGKGFPSQHHKSAIERGVELTELRNNSRLAPEQFERALLHLNFHELLQESSYDFLYTQHDEDFFYHIDHLHRGAKFSTIEAAVKARLRDEHGLFVMHAESSITVPQTFQQIDNTLKSVWPEVHMCHLYIQMYSTLWSIAIAGDRDSVKSLDRNTLAQRLHARGVGGLHAYTPDSHHAMQAGFPFIDALREQAAGLPIITDAHSTFVSSCHVDGSDINELLNPED